MSPYSNHRLIDSDSTRSTPQSNQAATSLVLVCGLGSLGQFCVAKLKEFSLGVHAIDVVLPQTWDIPDLPKLLDSLTVGDFRQSDILQRAEVQTCRAVLLVASDEGVNIDAAFAVRLLNPTARLVVRSTKHNLNDLLAQRLGNFVALDAIQLPAPAFTSAALSSEIRGLIHLEQHVLRVIHFELLVGHPWCHRRCLHELNSRTRRVLNHAVHSASLPSEFHQWEPDARLQAGDSITYIEVADGVTDLAQVSTSQMTASPQRPVSRWQAIYQYVTSRSFSRMMIEGWQAIAQHSSQRAVVLVGMTVLTLIVLGALLLKTNYPQQSWGRVIYTTMVMLLGAYDAVFSALGAEDTYPVWMRFLNLTYMLAGTASIAVLYAVLTENLLSAKFELANKRPTIPHQNHVIIVGLGRVGRQIATLLQQLRQSLVCVNSIDPEPQIPENIPLVVGELTDALTRVNLATARSVILATDDEMLNLELGLMAHEVNPHANLIIRTFDPRFSDNLARFLPQAQVLCVYELAAAAFAAATLGENVLNLLRLNHQTVLVAEYFIQENDPLLGLLIAEAAYGYGIVPIQYQAANQSKIDLMPSEEIRLGVGDRLVALVTASSLQRLELQHPLPKTWQVQIDKTMSQQSQFEAARTLSRVTGCNMNTAIAVMAQLPGAFPELLYHHQALRLVRELSKAQTVAYLIAGSTAADELAADAGSAETALGRNRRTET
jgi:Trk K+ transport system NAD-binding subunit